LSLPTCGTPIRPPPPASKLVISSDASSSFGLGVVIGNEWMAWRLLQGWKADHRDIGWAEAIAVELALEWAIALGTSSASMTMHCDNQGFVHAWKAGRSRNTQQNETIARIAARAATSDIWISIIYIASALNPADRPSRGLAARNCTPSTLTLPIPDHLRTFISITSLI
jgi:hypothetical protein